MIHQIRFSALALAVVLAFANAAKAVETLGWEHLAPPSGKFENPVADLNEEQLQNLSTIVFGPNYGAESAKLSADEKKAYENLRASGVDLSSIIDRIDRLRKEADRNDQILIFDLDKKIIKLPGYVLPLDFEGTLVKSFLLVPFVGACIHVPPPPPNQIVYVQAEKAFKSDELYAPVWVTGQITVGMGKKSLSLVDGSNDVSYGYSMQATIIKPYEG